MLLRPDQLQQKRTGGYELVWAPVTLFVPREGLYHHRQTFSLSDLTQEKVYNSLQQND